MTKLGHKDAIVLFRPKTLQNKFEPSEVIYEGADPVDKWVKANYHGICGVSRLIIKPCNCPLSSATNR